MFGRGMVSTPEDFGSQGRLPTHPELLDWLARVRRVGVGLKALLRRMVLSATYRQSSRRRRRSALSAIRATSGSRAGRRTGCRRSRFATARSPPAACSSTTIGGPSVYPYQPPGLWEELATRNATTYAQGKGDDLYRRSLYTVWKRTSPPPSAISFDAAERLFCTVRRQRTNTPLQALVLLNDPQFVEAARALAERAC